MYCQLKNNNKKLLKEECFKFRRRSVGVCYGRLASLLDAANCIKKEWDKVTNETIKNAFIKADLRKNLYSDVTETFDNNDFLKLFKKFTITATKQDMNEFQPLMMKAVICFKKIYQKQQTFFEEQRAVNEDENITSDADEPMGVDTISQSLKACNILNNVYAKSVIVDGELSSAEIQAVVGNNYGNLQSAFNNF